MLQLPSTSALQCTFRCNIVVWPCLCIVVHATANLGPTECADTVAMLAQGTSMAGVIEQAFLPFLLSLRTTHCWRHEFGFKTDVQHIELWCVHNKDARNP
jgi:hypothetical protein